MLQAVHFQFMKDGGKLAEKLFSANRQFIASIVPDLLDKDLKTRDGEEIYGRIHPPENYYPEWAIEIFKANRANHNVIWIQEGYRHCCGRCFNRREAGNGKTPDPFHEHVCLDGNAQTFEGQVAAMSKGKELLDKLEIFPEGYCPPNHLYNQDTIEAANLIDFTIFLTRNGFDYFPFTRGKIQLPAYWEETMIILPESKYSSSPVRMSYYDRMSEGELNEFLTSEEFSLGFDDLQVLQKPKAKVRWNESAIRTAKKLRDLRA